LFQGLYKLRLNVLQIPNQVRDDGSLLKWRFFVGKALFPGTKNPFPELVEGNLVAKKYGPSTGRLTLRCGCRDRVVVRTMLFAHGLKTGSPRHFDYAQ